jgi:uncharacterized membrane protein HdeD (DUF308 family)
MPSGAAFNTPDDEPDVDHLHHRAVEDGQLRGLSQAEGIMIVLGILALSFPVVASASVTVMVAIAFLLAGILGWIDIFMRAKRLDSWYCFWRLAVSTLLLVTGVWMVIQFKSGAVPAALQIKALATTIGLVSLSNRARRGWGWGLANGLVTLALGLLILTMGPAGLLSVIGQIVGISFIFSGFDLLGFSSRLHSRLN